MEDELRGRSLDVYAQVQQMHQQTYVNLERMCARLGAAPNMEQAVDAIAMLKKTDDLVRDLKAEINKTIKKMSRVAVALYMRSELLGEPVRTDWVSGSMGTKSIPKIAKRSEDPEAYAAMCAHYGVPVDAPFRPHWPDMVDAVTATERDLKPLPPGIKNVDDLGTEFVVTCRWKKGIEPDTLLQERQATE